MEVSSQLHASLFVPQSKRSCGTHHMGGLIVSRTSLLAMGEEKHLLPLHGIKLSYLSCSSHSIVTVSTLLFQLLVFDSVVGFVCVMFTQSE
jgi:hypothetical protein